MAVPSKSFHILRLPYLAIAEVIKEMDPFEKIAFSMTSSKCKKLAMSCKLSKLCHLALYIVEEPCFRIKFDDYQFEYIMTSDPSENGDRWVDENEDELEVALKYSENILKGFMEFVEYVKEVLDLHIEDVLYTMDKFLPDNRYIIEWLKVLAPSSLEINGGRVSREDVQYVLNNLRIEDELSLDVDTLSNLPIVIPNRSRSLIIRKGEWFKLKHLLSLDAPHITIKKTNISYKDLNVFLKKWMLAECHANLYQLEVDIPDGRTFFRIFHELVLEHPDRDLPTRQFNDIVHLEGVTIKNKNGILANLQALGMDDYFVFRMSIIEKDG